MLRSAYSPETIPGIDPRQMRSKMVGVSTGAIFLHSSISTFIFVVKGMQSAPMISRWDRGDICRSATRPAKDS